MRKIPVILIVIVLAITYQSCKNSQFSSTVRTFKNGHYVNVKKEKSNRPGFHAGRKYLKASKTDTAVIPAGKDTPQQPRIDFTIAGIGSGPELLAEIVTKNSKVTAFPEVFPTAKSSGANIDIKPVKSHLITTPGKNENLPPVIMQKKDRPSPPDTVYQKRVKPEAFSNKKNVSVGGMVCGIIGLFIAGIIMGSIAISSGISGLIKIKKQPNRYKGKGFAISSLVLGVLDIVGLIIVLAILLKK